MARTTLSARFGARVRLQRQARGWSQAELAEAVGLSPNHVGVMERGEKAPTLDTVEAVARALGTTPSQLLADGDEKGQAAWVRQVEMLAEAVPAGRRALLAAVVAAFAAEEGGETGRRGRGR